MSTKDQKRKRKAEHKTKEFTHKGKREVVSWLEGKTYVSRKGVTYILDGEGVISNFARDFLVPVDEVQPKKICPKIVASRHQHQ